MILSDRDIKKFFDEKRIKIFPEPNWKVQLGPASVDFRLGNEFRIFNHSTKPYIDPKKEETFRDLTRMVTLKNEEASLHSWIY